MKSLLACSAIAAAVAGAQHGWFWLLAGAVAAGILLAVRDRIIMKEAR